MIADSSEGLVARANDLAGSGTDIEAADRLLADVGQDRRALEGARDQVAAHLHAHVDDFQATATLQLLNRALSRMVIDDPLDWKVRWHQRFRRP